jgi:beta-N-acetylhexosaminidase
VHHAVSRRTLLTATTGLTAASASAAVPFAVDTPDIPATATTATTLTADASGDPRLRDDGTNPDGPDGRPDPQRVLAGMSLEEKVGQLFVLRVYGHSATDPDPVDVEANLAQLGVRSAAELIAKYHAGGIIYFAWAHNTRDPQQIAALSNGIQRASRLPVLIATDQEHGVVTRIGRPATLLPGAMSLGAGGSATDARAAAFIAGRELAAMGVNQDYAPVADVNTDPANPIIGIRSFGADPNAVSILVAAQVRGYQGGGVAATAKHFPGHGDTVDDSHTALPTIHHSRDEWEELDEPPFRAAIEAGVEAIMTAHIVVPALDPSGDPATLSHPILTGILRERLGFDGVIVTDALDMAGVRQKYGDDRVPVLALKAGADQLLNPPDPDLAWHSVLDAVRSGELSEARIDTSVLRILELKARRGLFDEGHRYVDETAVDKLTGTAEHLDAADRMAERGTTLLANEGGLLPLSPATHPRLLVTGADPASPTGTTGPPTKVLAAALTALGFTATALPDATSEAAVAAARGKDAVVVTTNNVNPSGPRRSFVSALATTGVPVIQLAVHNPYDIALLTGVSASLASYCWTDVELRAAARVIAGQVDPVGKLPVAVPKADDPTRMLYPIGYGLSY